METLTDHSGTPRPRRNGAGFFMPRRPPGSRGASCELPSGKYFCTLNIDLPEMEQSLRDSVREGETAFVVTRSAELRNSDGYTLVDRADLFFEGRTWTYYLYRRVSLTEPPPVAIFFSGF